MRHLERLLLIAILALTVVPSVRACTIPVFRYALERWDLSTYELLVFHRGELPKADDAFLEALPNRANVVVKRIDIDGKLSPAHRQLWESQGKATAPWAILRRPDKGATPPAWSGPLDVAMLRTLVDSPARQRIVKSLSGGDSAVFVLLESGDAAADQAVRKSLERELGKLERLVKLPEQSRDGPRIRLALPLKVSLPVLSLKRDEPGEEAFVRMLLGSEDGLAKVKGPIVLPIFGRGRLLGALYGDDLKAETFYDVVSFLCGECSCQVKEMNPGSDLLIAADWPAIFDRIGPAPDTGPEMPMGVTRLARAKPLAGLSAIAPGMSKAGDGLETEVRVAFAHDSAASPSAMGHVDERTGTLTDEAEKPCRCWLWTAILVAGFLVMATGTWATIHWARSARTQAQRA